MKIFVKYFIIVTSIFCCFFTKVSPYEKENIYGFIVVDNLRIRTRPSIKSDTIQLLTENDKILILGFFKNKTTISLRKNKITAPWYKIKFKNKTGWVFGGGVSLSSPVTPKLKDKIINSYYGYTIKTKNGSNIQLRNENFEFLLIEGLYFSSYQFDKYSQDLNCYLFNIAIYGGSPDVISSQVLVNRLTGFKISIPTDFSISPDNKYISSAFYYEPGGVSQLIIYKVNSKKIIQYYSKDYYKVIFEKSKWISNNKLKISFIRDWAQKKPEYIIYQLGKELNISIR